MNWKKKEEKLSKEIEDMAFDEERGTELSGEKSTDSPKLDELGRECAEWKDKYLRSMAEFENYRRRSIQEKSDWIKLSTQKLALDICDVVDNFERALMQVKDSEKDSSLIKGVLMIEQLLKSILEKEGVRKIDALGKEFDPCQHEALAHIPSEYEENTVAAVIQNGYTMHNKVIRPARVAVSSKQEKASGDASCQSAEDEKDADPDVINIEIK